MNKLQIENEWDKSRIVTEDKLEDKLDTKKAPIDPLMELFASGTINPSTSYYDCYNHGYNLGLQTNKEQSANDAIEFAKKFVLEQFGVTVDERVLNSYELWQKQKLQKK